jgi:hypothetical protein
MLPLLAPGAVGLTVVADTFTVTPAHGLGGVVLPPPPLPHEKPVNIMADIIIKE